MERLTGLDAGFLYTETPSAHMHVAGFAVFDPKESLAPVTLELVIELLTERLHLVPMFRRRLAMVPFGLHHPVWVDDPDFDIEKHVRWVTLPAPGGRKELADFVGDETSRPLDRSRPLWELVMIDGLEDGMMASFTKTHHAAIDGVAGVELSMAIADLSPEPTRYDPVPWEPEKVPSDFELLAYGLRSRAAQPFGMAKAIRAAQLSAQAAAGEVVRSSAKTPQALSAPATSFNRAITAHRAVAFGEMSLDDIKAIKNALGGTVNDVVLAICSSIMRTYFDATGEDIDEDLVAVVPISVRSDDDKDQLGNRISTMLVKLANTIVDPVERLHAITESTKDAKEQHKAIGADTMGNFAEFAPPRLSALAARLYSQFNVADLHKPAYNLTISNVPGVPFPLYSFGAKMQSSFPLGPIQEGSGLNITVTSYMGQMYWGIHCCRDLVADPWIMIDALDGALDELLTPAKAAAADGGKPATEASDDREVRRQATAKKAAEKKANAKKAAVKKAAAKQATAKKAAAKRRAAKKSAAPKTS